MQPSAVKSRSWSVVGCSEHVCAFEDQSMQHSQAIVFVLIVWNNGCNLAKPVENALWYCGGVSFMYTFKIVAMDYGKRSGPDFPTEG